MEKKKYRSHGDEAISEWLLDLKAMNSFMLSTSY